MPKVYKCVLSDCIRVVCHRLPYALIVPPSLCPCASSPKKVLLDTHVPLDDEASRIESRPHGILGLFPLVPSSRYSHWLFRGSHLALSCTVMQGSEQSSWIQTRKVECASRLHTHFLPRTSPEEPLPEIEPFRGGGTKMQTVHPEVFKD